jgi:hypothetical protein
MPKKRDATLALRQRRHKQALYDRGGRRVYFDLPAEAVDSLERLRARYSLPQAAILTTALMELDRACALRSRPLPSLATGGEEE